MFFEQGLSYSRIHSEQARAEECFYEDVTFDGVGNAYAIEFDRGGDYLHPRSVIMKYPKSGGESLFAVLDVSPELEAWFEAISCDRSGNMIVVVVSRMKGIPRSVGRRDYYLVDGMPKLRYEMLLPFVSGSAIVLVMVIAFFRILFDLRFRSSRPARW